MNQKTSHSPWEAVLEKLEPNRRQFLGLMLAGAAALPTLTSTVLAAEEKHNANKNATTTKAQKAQGKSSNAIKITDAKQKNSSMQQKGAQKNIHITSYDHQKSADKSSPSLQKNSHKSSDSQYLKIGGINGKTANTQQKGTTAIKQSQTGPQ